MNYSSAVIILAVLAILGISSAAPTPKSSKYTKVAGKKIANRKPWNARVVHGIMEIAARDDDDWRCAWQCYQCKRTGSKSICEKCHKCRDDDGDDDDDGSDGSHSYESDDGGDDADDNDDDGDNDSDSDSDDDDDRRRR